MDKPWFCVERRGFCEKFVCLKQVDKRWRKKGFFLVLHRAVENSVGNVNKKCKMFCIM